MKVEIEKLYDLLKLRKEESEDLSIQVSNLICIHKLS